MHLCYAYSLVQLLQHKLICLVAMNIFNTFFAKTHPPFHPVGIA